MASKVTIFMGWLKFGRIAVKNSGRHQPGQVLGLIGPPDCGKSLIQSMIITPALGGRVADPGLFLLGRTDFNADMFGSEHLSLGDESLGDNGRERSSLRDALKKLVAEATYPLHPKYQTAITLRPIWRLSLSVNDDPESANNIPALEASFADKVTYLKCYATPEPFFDAGHPTAREEFAARLVVEMPAFLHAVDNCQIPVEMLKGRYGIAEWQHPDVLELLDLGNPLNPLSDRLLAWMDYWADGNTSFCQAPQTEQTITSAELYRLLDNQMGHVGLHGISNNPAHLGHQLARLATQPNWRGILTRRTQRTGGRERNLLQTLWHFQVPGTTPQPEGFVVQSPFLRSRPTSPAPQPQPMPTAS